MFLPIIQNIELFDFQKSGNFNNYKWGLPVSPQDSLLTFSFYVSGGMTLTSFDAKKISISGSTVTVLSTTDLLTLYPPTETGTTRYEQNASTLLSSNLDDGLYYYYFSDGNFEMKSELFCIQEGLLLAITGEVFNIFNTTGYSNKIIIDDSGNGLDFTLAKGRAMYSNNDVVLKFQSHINLSDFTVEHRGTATWTVDEINRKISFGVGTIYALSLKNTVISQTLYFPFVENYNYIHDVNYNERAGVAGGSWVDTQDEIFVVCGMTKIATDEHEKTIYIPYNQLLAPCYNEDNLNSNVYKSGVDYLENQIFYEAGTYYYWTADHTSTYFSNDSASYTTL